MLHQPNVLLPILSYFEMRTVLQFDPRRCRHPHQRPDQPDHHTASDILYLDQQRCAWHQFGVWQHFLHELTNHKFSAHNFLGLRNDCTVFTIFHYLPMTFTAFATTSRRVRQVLRSHRRLSPSPHFNASGCSLASDPDGAMDHCVLVLRTIYPIDTVETSTVTGPSTIDLRGEPHTSTTDLAGEPLLHAGTPEATTEPGRDILLTHLAIH